MTDRDLKHDDLEELLGAYALDAVDGDEAAAVEAHLADCPRCRAELADLRETAALLAHSGADAPAGVWDRIAAELHDTPPPLRLEVRRGEQFERKQRLLRIVSLAAAAVVIIVLAFSVQRLSSKVDDLESAQAALSSSPTATGPGGVDLAAAANRALTEPDARVARLTSAAGQAPLAAVAVVRANGQGFLLGDSLPTLAGTSKQGRIYELWGATQTGQIAALGTVSGPGVYAFTADPSVHVVMVTEEAGPVAAPTSPAIVTGTLS